MESVEQTRQQTRQQAREEIRTPADEYAAKLESGDLAGALCLARAYDWTRPLICYHTSFFIDKLVFLGDRQRAAQVAAAIGNDTQFYLFNRLRRVMNIPN